MLPDHHWTTRRRQQRITIRRRARHHLHADVATSTAAVLDDHRLAEGLGEFLGPRPRHHIGSAAGGKIDDDANGFRWPRLRLRAQRKNGTAQQNKQSRE